MPTYHRWMTYTSPVVWLPVHWVQLRAQCSVTSIGSLYLFYRQDTTKYCHVVNSTYHSTLAGTKHYLMYVIFLLYRVTYCHCDSSMYLCRRTMWHIVTVTPVCRCIIVPCDRLSLWVFGSFLLYRVTDRHCDSRSTDWRPWQQISCAAALHLRHSWWGLLASFVSSSVLDSLILIIYAGCIGAGMGHSVASVCLSVCLSTL